MAQQEVKITFKIEGIDGEIQNVEDLSKALKKATVETKDLDDATKDLGESAEGAAEASDGAFTVLDEATGGLASRLRNVGTGLKAMGKQAVTAFKASVKGAGAMRKALISTGIGAIVVALGLIVAYWEDIKGLVSGTSRAQRQLLADTEATRDANAQNLSITEESENSLKLAGKSEREIRDLKIQQTNEVILATEALLEQQKQVKKTQIEAAERNQKITAGIIGFLTAPVTVLLGAIDQLTKGLAYIGVLEEGTNLAEGYLMGAASFLFDPEDVAAENDEIIAETEQTLRTLKNKRDGFIVANQAEDKKAAEDAKQAREDAAQAQADADQAELERKKNLRDKLREFALADIDNAYEKARAELAIQEEAALEELALLGATEEQKQQVRDHFAKEREKLAKEEADYQKQLRQEVIDNDLELTSGALGAIAQLAGEGSAVAKAAALAQVGVDTYVAAQKAYTSQLIPGDPTSMIRATIAAGIAVASGVANARAIMKTETPGGATAGGSVPTRPSIPTFNPRQTINTPTGGDNVVTPESQTVVKAYVVAEEMTNTQEANKKINDLAKL